MRRTPLKGENVNSSQLRNVIWFSRADRDGGPTLSVRRLTPVSLHHVPSWSVRVAPVGGAEQQFAQIHEKK